MKKKMVLMVKRHSFLCRFVLILLLLLSILFCGDNVGLSNNGDFQRVMFASSIKMVNRDASFVFEDTYAIELSEESMAKNYLSILFGGKDVENYPSIHLVFTRISAAINLFINQITKAPLDTYRLSVLAVIYAILYAGILAFFLAQIRFRSKVFCWLFQILALVILCDVGYVSYFGSLYGEALQHVAFVFWVAVTLRMLRKPSAAGDMVLSLVAALFYGGSKFFNLPLALFCVLINAAIFLFRRKLSLFPVLCGGLGILCLLFNYTQIPKWMDVVTNYNAVFYGALYEVEDSRAETYIADLGLPAAFSDYRDTNYYISWVPERLAEDKLEESINALSKTDLIKFYATHPGRVMELLPISAGHSDMLRPYYLSNYDETHPRMSLSPRFSLWSSWRNRLPFGSVWGNGLLIALFLLFLWRHFRKGKDLFMVLSLGILALCGYAFLAPIAFNGIGDLAKHQFAFIEIMDFVFLGILGLLLFALETPKERKNGLFGLALLLIFVLINPLSSGLRQLAMEHTSHDNLEPGSYVSLGHYEGEDLLWQVVTAEEDSVSLMSVSDLAVMAFDETGKNEWQTASVRTWLNSELIGAFREEERKLLLNTTHKVTCNVPGIGLAETGDTEFLCNHLLAMADMNYERAYAYQSQDFLRLPDAFEVTRIHEKGYLSKGEYWLETAYAPNDYLSRYLSADGHVLMAQSDQKKGIRPMVSITYLEPASGKGTARNPFVLTESEEENR